MLVPAEHSFTIAELVWLPTTPHPVVEALPDETTPICA
jgi:hypothetical protein